MRAGEITWFQGGAAGAWRVRSIAAITGPALPAAAYLSIESGPLASAAAWTLRGQRSHVRYAAAAEVAQLRARQEDLGRPQATCAALIPIRKSQTWWDLAQDERRALFEETSRHTAIGLEYLPAIARRLYHSRDLGEPFDFLTWFEYAPADAGRFDALVARLRATAEWTYVDAEVDIRLTREA